MSAITTLRRALLATHVDAFHAHALPRMAALSLALFAAGCVAELPTTPASAELDAQFGQGTRPGAHVVLGDLVLMEADAPALATTCASQSFTRNAWTLAFSHSQCLIVSPAWASAAYPPYTLTDDITLSVQLEKGKNGRITHVRLYGQDIIGDAGIAHETDWVPVAVPVIPVKTGFTLHVHASNVQVWRLDSHLSGGNRVEMIGTISIGDFIYP